MFIQKWSETRRPLKLIIVQQRYKKLNDYILGMSMTLMSILDNFQPLSLQQKDSSNTSILINAKFSYSFHEKSNLFKNVFDSIFCQVFHTIPMPK